MKPGDIYEGALIRDRDMITYKKLEGKAIQTGQRLPLVSLFCFCRNAVHTIRRCIDSMLAQDYPYVEIIVQDGASTDGTLEILSSYGDRIHLVAEPDQGPGDAMFRCLRRVRGDIFGSCLADEQMLPHAVSWGLFHLLFTHPDAGVVYGDHHTIDISGSITGTVRPEMWNFKKVLASEFMPPFCTSFFNTAGFRKIGLERYTDCGEFEIWIRMGACYPIYYVPGVVSRYGVHDGELSFQVKTLEQQANGKIKALERLFHDPSFPDSMVDLKSEAIMGVYTWLLHCYCNCRLWEKALGFLPEVLRRDSNTDRLAGAAARLLQHGITLFKRGAHKEAGAYLQLPAKVPRLFEGLDSAKIADIQAKFSSPEHPDKQIAFP